MDLFNALCIIWHDPIIGGLFCGFIIGYIFIIAQTKKIRLRTKAIIIILIFSVIIGTFSWVIRDRDKSLADEVSDKLALEALKAARQQLKAEAASEESKKTIKQSLEQKKDIDAMIFESLKRIESLNDTSRKLQDIAKEAEENARKATERRVIEEKKYNDLLLKQQEHKSEDHVSEHPKKTQVFVPANPEEKKIVDELRRIGGYDDLDTILNRARERNAKKANK